MTTTDNQPTPPPVTGPQPTPPGPVPAAPLAADALVAALAGASKRRASKTKLTSLAQRAQLWPEITDNDLWIRDDKSRKGFTTIPRLMPLFMEVVADASKRVTSSGKSAPAGKALLVLWCRVFDEGLVKIDSEATAAFEAGYTGERKVSTWREHMKVLQALGFIDFKEGPAGPCQYVLLLNPYHATKKLHEKGWIQPVMFTAIVQRAGEVGATDMNDKAA